jgi:hypothetical protein
MTPRPLSPLRVACAEAVLTMISGDVHLDDYFYADCRLCGLTRAQIDLALDDLAAAGEIVLIVDCGQIVARSVSSEG